MEANEASPEASLRKARISFQTATTICKAALREAEYSEEQATVITDHLIDAELRGHPFAGLARALSIVEHLQASGKAIDREIRITRSGPAFAHVDGGDNVGYLVARRATRLAIEKAKEIGISLVGANGLWYTGNLAYYAEMAAKEGLATITVSNGSRIVAPHGGCEPKFCTNPICIGFPTGQKDKPVIWDIGTSKIMFAQVMLAQRLGIGLPEGTAFDNSGQPTTDPLDVLEGAMAAWGGYKGSGLAMMVQLLGIAAGSDEPVPFMSNFGFLIIAFDPSVLQPRQQVESNTEKFVASIKSTKMLPGEPPARLPFERSIECRKEAISRGWIEVDERVVQQLRKLSRDCSSSERSSGRRTKTLSARARNDVAVSRRGVPPTLRPLISQQASDHQEDERPRDVPASMPLLADNPAVENATFQSAFTQQEQAAQTNVDGMVDMHDPPTTSSGAAYLGGTGIMPIFAPEARIAQPTKAYGAHRRDILPPELQESFLETYREYSWPWCPVLDDGTIQKSIEFAPSPLLINALALLGTRIRPPMATHAGSAEYYRRAKMLFYGDEEADHIVSLQSILLFYWWAPQSPNTVNKDAAWWWTGLAIKYGQQLGLHQEPKNVHDVGGAALQGLRRRIWWTLFARERLTSICQGRPCTIDPDDCTVREPSLDDFPSPVDPRAHVFIHWVRLCGIIGRVGQHLSRTSSHSFPTLLACELIDWISNTPNQLKLPISSRRTRPFVRDVHKLHLPYLTTITILHMSPSSQHPQHSQQPLPEVYTPAITAASCVARIFKDLLARGDIRFLGAIATWYVGVAIVALLSTQSLEHLAPSALEDIRILRLALNELAPLWPTATIFIRGFERLKAFEALDRATEQSSDNGRDDAREGHPFTPMNDASANAADELNTTPTLSNPNWMNGIDWRSYFPFITEETSALVAEILATENQMYNFLTDDFRYDDPSLALQDLFNSANALDPLLMDGGLPF
ncbi:uncharacterized protein HMPREF1541_07041 [Cyphellophora europaea CBS 101466]|uniref:Xylanolytic transcriptional activator regulatory domain-containing protein n=1 Tax=Cyphellophora europaea (strain CBS 101466) TaxID=1220924 RepID=W2RTG6_CYPE1|nr:uncharacterized protein HMPREF1541_07041 [Cyphellophora europaea CBS 101466]ETN38999.1 hypothetical protein HMPREF1541_07041 [Cyphellophora europaea CBS 101466]